MYIATSSRIQNILSKSSCRLVVSFTPDLEIWIRINTLYFLFSTFVSSCFKLISLHHNPDLLISGLAVALLPESCQILVRRSNLETWP